MESCNQLFNVRSEVDFHNMFVNYQGVDVLENIQSCADLQLHEISKNLIRAYFVETKSDLID